MELLDRLAFFIKSKVPPIYGVAEWLTRGVTIILHGNRICQAINKSRLEGTVQGEPAVMRAIGPADIDAMMKMFESMPEEHLRFFHPHRLDRASVRKVLARRTINTYGLFVGDQMLAYAMLKLFFNKKAYIGRLVSQTLIGLGVGKFLSRYLYWQNYLLGFQPYSTIHPDNVASLKSHFAVRPYEVVGVMANGYNLVKFAIIPSDADPPVLDIKRI